MSKSGALATRPRRETLSAYEKAQIYMTRKQEEEARAAQASSGKSLCDSSGNELNTEGDHKDSTTPESKANLKRLVTTGMSRGSTQGSSDWLHAWGVDSDMKKGFDMNDSFPELEKPSQTPREVDEEDNPAAGKKGKDKSKTFSKVKEALKSKLRRSKTQQDHSESPSDDEESISCKP